MKLQQKNYNITDYIKLPFQVASLYTTAVVLLRIIMACMPSIQVLVTAAFLDAVMAYFSHNISLTIAVKWFAYVILCILAKDVLGFLYRIVKAKLTQKVEQNLTLAVIEKRASLEYQYIENSQTWELIERIGDDVAVKWMKGMEHILSLAVYVVEMAGLIIIIGRSHIILAIVTACLLVPFFVISMKNGADEYEAYEDSSQNFRRAKYFKSILSSREYAQERYLFGFAPVINRMWEEQFANAIHIEKRANKMIFTRVTIGNVLAVTFSCVIMGVLISAVIAGRMTVGIYISLIKGLLDFIESISWKFAQLVQDVEQDRLYAMDMTRFTKLSEEANVLKNIDTSVRNKKITCIEFRNVTFTYPGMDKPILNQFNAVLQGDKTYAIVGENGAGKTTLTKLLTGLYRDYEGEILIDGEELRSFPSEKLRGYFAMVYQDFAKYAFTLGENIWLDRYAGEESQALLKEDSSQWYESLGIKEIEQKVPFGLETSLGRLTEQGVDLSGGQWQRVAIARALQTDAPVTIMDEPTAALDPMHEAALYRLFYEVMHDRFAIFITHRLGAAKMADEILVLQNGAVVEYGTHEMLLQKQGLYAQMYDVQRGWYHE